MSAEQPVNITINVSDTVPLSLYRSMETLFEAARKRSFNSDNTAAELRIEVAALTVARETDESRIKGLHQKVRELESEKHTLRDNLIDKINQLNRRDHA